MCFKATTAIIFITLLESVEPASESDASFVMKQVKLYIPIRIIFMFSFSLQSVLMDKKGRFFGLHVFGFDNIYSLSNVYELGVSFYAFFIFIW